MSLLMSAATKFKCLEFAFVRAIRVKQFLPFLLGAFCIVSHAATSAEEPVRDVTFFLHRLRTVDHLPLLEDSHTALASTWDRTGGNWDGTDFKGKNGATNLLFDADGPGCVHRIFTGGSEPGRPDIPGYLRVDGTRLQIFLDHDPVPLFDIPVTEFFDPSRGPVLQPLAGDKQHGWTYPGCLLPIPYAKHCRVQLVNPGGTNWGCYWQIAYTTFKTNAAVNSLTWPLSRAAQRELDAVRKAWTEIQSGPPTPPKWTFNQALSLAPRYMLGFNTTGPGVIRQLRVAVQPATPEVLQSVHLVLRWNGDEKPSVDMSVGDFFGHRYTGYESSAQFNSMLLGVTKNDAYTLFPMPFLKGASVMLTNVETDAHAPIAQVRLSMLIEKGMAIPDDCGWFSATHLEAPAAMSNAPTFGLKNVPGHLVLEHQGRGKYVGVLMREDWPHDGWWGEGDWMIWTDETAWPPSYHGTGTEEYFNSGWCLFDRKAISGFVAIHPGNPTQYSFHLNDAFQFQRNIRVAVETMGWDKADELIREEHPVWASTAFWYAR